MINLQKKAGKSLLKSLSSLLKTEAYLAGGMLRDHYFQREGNDFDIYVKRNHNFDYDAFMVPLLNGTHGYSNFIRKSDKDVYHQYAETGNIYALYEGYFEAHNVKTQTQVIVLDVKPRDYIENYFCCSLSKVWQTQDFQPVYTSEFIKSVEDRTISFNFKNLGKVNYDYISKILDRFPDFEVDEETKKYYIDKIQREAYWRLN